MLKRFACLRSNPKSSTILLELATLHFLRYSLQRTTCLHVHARPPLHKPQFTFCKSRKSTFLPRHFVKHLMGLLGGRHEKDVQVSFVHSFLFANPPPSRIPTFFSMVVHCGMQSEFRHPYKCRVLIGSFLFSRHWEARVWDRLHSSATVQSAIEEDTVWGGNRWGMLGWAIAVTSLTQVMRS